MVKGFPDSNEGGVRKSGNNDKFSLGDLDLLNLRLNFSSDEADTTKVTTYGHSDRGSGDSFLLTRPRSRHPLEKAGHYPPVPNLSRVPQGYARSRRPPATISSENLHLLCSKETNPAFHNTGTIDSKDFLFPSRRKTHTKVIDVVSDCRFPKYEF